MKVSQLLKIPMSEDKALEGVLYTTGLIDVDVTYLCNALHIDNSLSNEEKRDLLVPYIKQADTFNKDFDSDVFKLLSILAYNYEPVDEELEDEEEFDLASNNR